MSFLDRMKKTRIARSIVYFIVGVFSYPGIAVINKLKITGGENLRNLPARNVLFVSNHQTYFADVITFLHIFCAVKWKRFNRLGFPIYLLNPFTRVNYVAAGKTMKSSLLSRFFSWAGAITVKRTWNPDARDSRKGLNPSDTRNISKALAENWVITFPQGTTKPFAPCRKGTAYLIKKSNPTVIPVVIDGFSKAFGKKGLNLKARGVKLRVTFKEPLRFSGNESLDEIMQVVMDSIEQSERFADPLQA